MTVRLAEERDFDTILRIYDRARKFMAETGNPTQWGTTNPPAELLREDIKDKHLFVVTDGEQVKGVFSFLVGPDRTYTLIEDGAWHCDAEYGTIHRIASDGTGGVFAACMEYCLSRCPYLRIDTHENNKVMQHVVTKHGFRRCGIIYTDSGSPRIAFDRI